MERADSIADLHVDTAPGGSRHNLPLARTSFVGREHLLADVRRLIGSPTPRTRLLTLTGPGGTGKTRLALAAANTLLGDYSDGVCFVGLASITDTRLVATTVAQALGVAGDGRRPQLEVLQSYLGGRRLLLVLDNFEQVLGAAVDVAELLSACPQLHILATSRAPLRLLGEHELVVPPLVLPDADGLAFEGLDGCESVHLFVDRARAVKTDFVLTDANAAAVGEICRRLDGLPLAIELAAARTRLLEPQAMLAPLERRLQLLTGGARDAPARQQTLRNTIAWSYDLLEPEEQVLFRRLAVFVGGCSLDAAQAVCEQDQLLDVVESLVARSLLRPLAAAGGEVRFGMLETIREYGLEQLAWSGELEPCRRRHAEYFLALAERAEPGLGGPDVRTWLQCLEIEHDNLRAALDWSVAESRPTSDTALRLAGALARFWWVGGHFREGSRWLERALAKPSSRGPARMKALYGAGWLAHVQRDAATARVLLEDSLAIAEQLDDGWARAWVLHVLGRVAYFEFDWVLAQQLGQRSLQIAQSVGDRWLIAWDLHLLGLAAYIGREDAAAHAYYEDCLEIRRELGHLEGLCIVLHLRGMLPHRAGDFASALKSYRQALDVAIEINSAWLYRCVLPLLASVAAEQQPTIAARLAGALTVMSESSHTLPVPLIEALFNAGIEVARRKLGEAAFAAEWMQGRGMSLDAAIAEAKTVEFSPSQTGSPPAHLTPAEVEVLRRLARGRTTRQIATELVVAVSTVDRHITHIYEKIGRRGRVAAAAFAAEHGLS